MRILLDTHVFLWWVGGETKLTKATKDLILTATEVYISSASIWESCIKAKLGKLKLNIDSLVSSIEESGFFELPITARHAATVYKLPNIHRDPFDRVLIAQAICEPLQLITFDKALAGYTDLVKIFE
jgi:PIN domain nuclease of toxin-antitoxin system